MNINTDELFHQSLEISFPAAVSFLVVVIEMYLWLLEMVVVFCPCPSGISCSSVMTNSDPSFKREPSF